MNEKYAKIINSIFPDSLILAVSEKTGVDKNSVEFCCAEVIAKVFGNGEDLVKKRIIARLNEVAKAEHIKEIIISIATKHSIESSKTGLVLAHVLPLIQSRLLSLDNSYFDVDEYEENKVIENETVDSVFKNIEKKVEDDLQPKRKEKHNLFNFKVRKNTVINNKREFNNNLSNSEEIDTIEKIAIGVVGISFLGLVITFIVLIIIS